MEWAGVYSVYNLLLSSTLPLLANFVNKMLILIVMDDFILIILDKRNVIKSMYIDMWYFFLSTNIFAASSEFSVVTNTCEFVFRH